MSTWNDLTMQQRADLIKIYLSHGISSLDEMRNHYDSRNQFAEGGNLYGLGDWLKKGWDALTSVGEGAKTTSGAGFIYTNNNTPPQKRTVYRSLTGKVFNTAHDAAVDNLNATKGRGEYADKDLTYQVQSGDSLWKISQANNIDVNTLRRMNPSIKGDLIYPGDNLIVGKQKGVTLKDVRKEWEKEKELNTDNLKAIQGVKHDDNYVVIDKLNNVLTVYDSNNQPVYQTSDISTGKSGNDYNTITYVDEQGKIRSGAGNESTPAGITKITGTGVYHGFPSFTRGRNQGDTYEDIASSLHFGGTKDKKASNGCVRIGGQSLQDLSNFIGMGTDVYTLPEKKGSGFKVKDGKLNFVADNPYGEQEGSKKYWDDYNTYTDKSYSPITIVDKKQSDNSIYHKNRASYANALSSSKERIQRMFNIDSDTYNRLANIALGIAEQETKYGTSTRKAVKDITPDVLLNVLRGNSNRSKGITQIKLHGDNKDMQAIYKQLGITDKTLESPEGAALATVARLAQMYNTEVRGRNFVGANKATINPYDALLYKWMGRGSELSNHTATPELNNYIANVKKYQNDFGIYTMRAYGGPLYEYGGPKRPPVAAPRRASNGNRLATMTDAELEASEKAADEYWKQQQQAPSIAKSPEEVEAEFREAYPEGHEGSSTLQHLSNLFDQATEQQFPITAEGYREAINNQVEEQVDKWHDYKKGVEAAVTATELGLSGTSLLGSYANWRNWANAANATKRGIANLLQRAQLPMQVGGTLIDGAQTYMALREGDDFDAKYNGISAGLGAAGSVGASDVFLNSRFHNQKIDRALDVLGIIQNAGDFLKFGYDSFLGGDRRK